MVELLDIVRLFGIPGKPKSDWKEPEAFTVNITTQLPPPGQVPAVVVPEQAAEVIVPPLSQPQLGEEVTVILPPVPHALVSPSKSRLAALQIPVESTESASF
jgi:hypothetical protein